MTSGTHRALVLVGLYVAQGLPFGFFEQVVPVVLRQGGASLSAIGFSNLLALPWALKFLWAPLFDRPSTRSATGRRRAILALQAVSILLVTLVALSPPEAGIDTFLLAVFLCNLVAATQDIATDGMAVDALPERERGRGNGIQVGGYRVGMIVGGGAILFAVDSFGWTPAVLGLAGLLGVASLPLLLGGPLETPAATAPQRMEARALDPWLLHGPARRWLGLLLLFKAGDAMGTGPLKPMLVDAGYTLGDIGALFGTLGSATAIAGAVAGAFLAGRFAPRILLPVAALLQAGSLLLWAAVAPDPPWAMAAVAIGTEHFFSSVATTAIFAAMMGACRPGHSAADYTVQASVFLIASGIARIGSGMAADSLGYPGVILLSAFVALLAVPAARLAPSRPWD